MVVFPAATPVTFPVPASTDATAVVLLLHTPPEILLLKYNISTDTYSGRATDSAGIW